MKTTKVTNRRICEFYVKLIASLLDEDLLHIASVSGQLAGIYRQKGSPAPSMLLWLATSLKKEHRRRQCGAQCEQIMFELPPENYAECPSALGANLKACMLLLRSLTADTQTQFIGEILHDLCILAKTRLDHFADLLTKIEFQKE